jgi:hypothetical protein
MILNYYAVSVFQYFTANTSLSMPAYIVSQDLVPQNIHYFIRILNEYIFANRKMEGISITLLNDIGDRHFVKFTHAMQNLEVIGFAVKILILSIVEGFIDRFCKPDVLTYQQEFCIFWYIRAQSIHYFLSLLAEL